MDKSLAPLIAVFALIILLSMILLNSNLMNQAYSIQKTPATQHEMAIRPESSSPLIPSKTPARNKTEHKNLINVGEALGAAKKNIAMGKNREAEELLRTILVFEPDHRQALSLLGGILYYSNRYKEAEIIFRHQIKLDPTNSLAYNRLGSALAKQKKYKEAIDTSSIAVGMNPDSGNGHINLAGMYAVVGDKKRALEHFKKAYKLIRYAILPISFDEAFDNIRQVPEFQSILFKAKQSSQKKSDAESLNLKKSLDEPKKIEPLFNSDQLKSEKGD